MWGQTEAKAETTGRLDQNIQDLLTSRPCWQAATDAPNGLLQSRGLRVMPRINVPVGAIIHNAGDLFAMGIHLRLKASVAGGQ